MTGARASVRAQARPPARPPALGVIEVSSIARGIVVADAMAKRAPVTLLASRTTSPGKYIVIFAGGVAEVDEALTAGVAAAGGALVDRLFLPYANAQLAPLVLDEPRDVPRPERFEAVAVFETFTICATLIAADAATKAADVTLLDLRLGQGLGGKGFFTMTGELDAVEAAAAAGRAAIEPGLLVGLELIAAPHDDLRTRLFW